MERLLRLAPEVTLVFVDDFIGRGGTIVGVSRLLAQLGLAALRYVAVVGADGDLYTETLAREKIEVTLLPHPFPLILPTFQRLRVDLPWAITA
jgi:adenine/guanine phosphoribosyltransferase-like PRPP-binding protein